MPSKCNSGDLPVRRVIGLVALGQRTQQPRHLTPHRLVQTLTGGGVMVAQKERRTEQARLALLLRQEVRLLPHALSMYRY